MQISIKLYHQENKEQQICMRMTGEPLYIVGRKVD
jgi:hypothetical protein